jgi:DNA repair ATPase RecN
LSDALDAFEQLAIYYEHHARQPERAAELTREALSELRRAVRTGDLDPRRYQKLKARLDHRLARLERKAGAAQARLAALRD